MVQSANSRLRETARQMIWFLSEMRGEKKIEKKLIKRNLRHSLYPSLPPNRQNPQTPQGEQLGNQTPVTNEGVVTYGRAVSGRWLLKGLEVVTARGKPPAPFTWVTVVASPVSLRLA